MNIGLIDVDHWKSLEGCFPNLPLMKLSAYHKSIGDQVEMWTHEHEYDRVYMSKVFTFTEDFSEWLLYNAKEIYRGGTGYRIKKDDSGREHFTLDENLPDHIEHIYPDYSLYGIKDTAYGFMSRGCPRGCNFCHVAAKEGQRSRKVADLSEFWRGQEYIELLDPNTLACPDWRDILQQLAESKAKVDFNQGVDIRVMTEEKAEYLTKKIKTKHVHFAWDRYEDGPLIKPRLEAFKKVSNWERKKVSVYILTNYNTTIEQDIERVEYVKSLNFQPYVMRYNKESIPKGHILNKLARYANNPFITWGVKSFAEYRR